MEDVIKIYRRRNLEQKMSVLRLELDYNLALLYEALVQGCYEEVTECKKRLNEIRKEMLALDLL